LDSFYISNIDKNGALAPLNIVLLMLKVLMDLISRVLIFFTFMIVYDRKFSPMRTLTSYYTVVGIMAIFNVVFNERRNFVSIKYWAGKF